VKYDDDWEAWCNIMPGARRSIMVTGCCELPRAGYRLELRQTERPPFNPKILELDVIVHEPSSPRPQVITHERATYFEYTEIEHDQVHVNPDGPVIKVQLAR